MWGRYREIWGDIGEARAEVLLGLQLGQRRGGGGQRWPVEAIASSEEASLTLGVGAPQERWGEAGQPAPGQPPSEGQAEEVQ